MPYHHESRHMTHELPDFSDTQNHIFLAARELLSAAVGVLKFCRTYVERTSIERPHPNMVRFFSKAIAVASELGSSMMKSLPLKETAEKLTRHVCDTIEREMRKQNTGVAQRHSKKALKKIKKVKSKKRKPHR